MNIIVSSLSVFYWKVVPILFHNTVIFYLVTFLAACICTFSYCSISDCVHPSNTNTKGQTSQTSLKSFLNASSIKTLSPFIVTLLESYVACLWIVWLPIENNSMMSTLLHADMYHYSINKDCLMLFSKHECEWWITWIGIFAF